MKIAVIGTGAMGSLFAALLARLADVIMVGSWTEQLRLVSGPGLIIHHNDGQVSQHILPTTTTGSDAFPVDLAIIAVKGWQTQQAAQNAQLALSPEGLALTLQNGLGNLEVIGNMVGSGRAVQGITSEGATMLRAGAVRHAGRGQTYFAATVNTRLRLERLAALFVEAGLGTQVVEDAQSLIWGKLVINAGINPLTALLQVPNGFLVEDARACALMSRAADEAAAVARALDISMPFADAAAQTAEVARATAANRSSMAQDIARGMPTEIEQITGAIIRKSRHAKVQVPVNEALYQLIMAQIEYGSWVTAIADLPSDLRSTFRYLLPSTTTNTES